MAQGKELEAIIKIVGNLDPSLEKAVQGASKAISGIGKGLAVAGTAAVAGMAAAGAAIGAASKAALELGQAFDSASDTIRIGTGATGEALEALEADFDEVYKSVPTTMDDAAQAIADYNTRLGLTGEELQGISEQAIQVSNMLGDDLGSVIEESSQAFQQWGIETADMGDAMDYVFKASQSTGMGFTELLSAAQQFGPQMQEMGFSFEETTALLGQLDKAGVNSSEVMAALKKSVTTMAKEGLSASEGLEKYITEIQEAGTSAEATAIAAEVFGSRAGSTMAAAIRDGTLAVGDLTAELLASDETILKAAEDTEDFPEKLQKLKQNAEVALKPIANQFMDIANDAIPYVEDALDTIVPVISSVMETAGPMIAEAADVLLPMVGDALQALSGTAEGFLPAIQEGLTWLWGILQELAPMLMEIGEAIMPVITQVMESAFSLVQQIVPIIMDISQTALPVVSAILQALSPIIATVLEAVQPIVEIIGLLVSELLPPIASMIQSFIPYLSAVASVISTALVAALKLLTPIIEAVIKIVGALGDIIAEVFGGLMAAVMEPINGLISLVNGIIDAINSISIDIPEWVPIFGGQTFSLNLPKIPTFAQGGFTDGVSIAGEAGTEAVISFDSAYRSANLDYWMKAGQMLGALNNDGSVNSESALAGKLLTIDDISLSGMTAGNTTYVYDFSGMSYSPTVNAVGADRGDIVRELDESREEFFDWFEKWVTREREARFA